MIYFEHVTKAFGSHVVLDDLTLHVPRGKITFIVGKSGEGKSVTIKHIMGLLKPDSGTIKVDGETVETKTKEELTEYRRKFGMLFQHAALFDSLTVDENVFFPLREQAHISEKEMRERVNQVLEQAGILEIKDSYPAELSTGEKKRVGLARALVAWPKVLLYDEPTTGFDPLVSEMIDELIVKVSETEKDLTSVVISHDLKAALATAENIIMLYKGKVALCGSPEVFKTTTDPIVRQFFSGKVEGPMEFL